jgi:hypothetical protein
MIARPPRNVKPTRFSGLMAGLLAGVACGFIATWIATGGVDRPTAEGGATKGPALSPRESPTQVGGPSLLDLVQTICKRTMRTSAARDGLGRHEARRTAGNGTRRTGRHEATGLITQRSLVQIQPAQRAKPQVDGPKAAPGIREPPLFVSNLCLNSRPASPHECVNRERCKPFARRPEAAQLGRDLPSAYQRSGGDAQRRPRQASVPTWASPAMSTAPRARGLQRARELAPVW